jgi:NTE family protein
MNFRKEALEIIKNKTALVLSGGGVLGIGEVQAIIKLEEYGLDLKKIKSITGSSVGSIIAMGIACGATSEYIKKKMNSINFIKLQNKDNILVEGIHLLKNYGLHDMSEVREFVSSILIDLGYNIDITFKQLFEKTGVFLTITYLSMNYSRTIYSDHVYEPDALVRESIIKSSSIPIFYEAYIEGYGKNKQVAIDGGIMLNYPMIIPRKQNVEPKEILGLKFISSDEVDYMDEGQPGTENENKNLSTNIVSHIYNLFQILRNQAMKIHVHKNDWELTVKINVGSLTSTDFNLTPAQKNWLIDQGEKAADSYIEELSTLLQNGQFL